MYPKNLRMFVMFYESVCLSEIHQNFQIMYSYNHNRQQKKKKKKNTRQGELRSSFKFKTRRKEKVENQYLLSATVRK